MTFRGIERQLQHVPQRARPMTPDILLRLADVAEHGDYLDHVCFTASLMLFFLMARAGNVLFDAQRPECGLKRQDIRFFRDKILVTFKRTKTIQFGKRTLVVPLFVSRSRLCVVSACQKMVLASPCIASLPLFLLDPISASPLSKHSFLSRVRDMLSRARVPDALDFSCHSFRRGGASWAFRQGLPGELIQVFGDWTSDCYKLYLEISMDTKLYFAKHIASTLR